MLFSALTGCTIQSPAVTAESSAPTLPPVTITVSAAASLTESFTEIGKIFQQDHPQVSLVFNFAGSQELAQQINQGAQVDVFASANQKQMDVVLTEKEWAENLPQVFASNELVVIFPLDNPGEINLLADLSKPGLKVVFAGPEVPVGQYSLDFLEKAEASGIMPAGFKAAVMNNIVSYENNVRAVVTKISLGEADAGIVYATDLGIATDTVGQLSIPDELNIIASYPILALPDSPQFEMGKLFVEFVLSLEAENILKKFGFSLVH